MVATQAAHEGFTARANDQLLACFTGVTRQRGERQADDEGSSTYGSHGSQHRTCDDQITNHGEDARIFDIFLIAVGCIGGENAGTQKQAGG